MPVKNAERAAQAVIFALQNDAVAILGRSGELIPTVGVAAHSTAS
jgi:hypothetical protein